MATFIGFGSPLIGNTKVLFDNELVKRDLINHFYTRKRERVMDVEYGFLGWDLLFELDKPSLKYDLEEDARRVVRSDPRVSERTITIDLVPNGYNINIDLYFLQTQTADTLYLKFTQQSAAKES